jgi:hypothetical protein
MIFTFQAERQIIEMPFNRYNYFSSYYFSHLSPRRSLGSFFDLTGYISKYHSSLSFYPPSLPKASNFSRIGGGARQRQAVGVG